MAGISKKARILIAEDEVIIAADLEWRLGKLGYEVCGKATTAGKALEMVEEHQPDLVMMDIVFQGDLHGIETAEVIREKWGLPVVFLTAYTDTDRLERAKLTYPFGYLLKPFQDRDLKVTTEMALYVAKVDAERQKAEHALRREQEMLSRTERIARIGSWEWETATDRVRWSEELFRLFQLDPGTPAPKWADHQSLFHPDDFDLLRRAVETAVSDGTPFEMELRVCGKDGGFRLCVARGFADKDSRGQVQRLFGSLQDITRRKQAEEALKKSEERLHFLIKNSSDILVIINEDGRQQYVSSASDRITGYSASELEGKSLRDIIHPDDFGEVLRVWNVALAHPDLVCYVQYRHIHKTRGWVHLEAMGQNFLNEPSVRGIVASVRDLTERMRAEAEKEKLQSQLLQAQKMEAIGTLAGGIAHDFNNLLQAINGYSQLLLMDKPEKDPEFSNLKAIQDAGGRASELVRQLLLFSRKGRPVRRSLELDAAAEQARMMLERIIPKMVSIEIHKGDKLWAIMADPVQVEQLLLNLGTNAADAMPEGGTLVLEMENTTLDEEFSGNHVGARPGPYVLLTVSDTGHGMDPETKDKIFEPFFTTKEFGKGTGLGLASVYGIVKSHGGYITCYSEKNQGTVFKLYFPAVEPDGPHVAQEPPANRILTGSERILLVDDEEAVRDLAQQTLAKFGYRVLTAANGEEALDIFSKEADSIDLVILDIGMPGMGGHRCLQELLNIDPKTRVIIASGYSFKGQAEKSMEAGAVGYLGKPFKIRTLLERIRETLDEDTLAFQRH